MAGIFSTISCCRTDFLIVLVPEISFSLSLYQTLKALSTVVRQNHPQYRNVETIIQKVPIEMRERMNRRPAADDSTLEPPSEKSLIRLHKQVL